MASSNVALISSFAFFAYSELTLIYGTLISSALINLFSWFTIFLSYCASIIQSSFSFNFSIGVFVFSSVSSICSAFSGSLFFLLSLVFLPCIIVYQEILIIRIPIIISIIQAISFYLFLYLHTLNLLYYFL